MSAPEQSTESKVKLPRGKLASCSLHLSLESFCGCFCSLARVDYAKAHLRECQQSTGWGRCSGYLCLTDVMIDCKKLKRELHIWPFIPGHWKSNWRDFYKASSLLSCVFHLQYYAGDLSDDALSWCANEKESDFVASRNLLLQGGGGARRGSTGMWLQHSRAAFFQNQDWDIGHQCSAVEGFTGLETMDRSNQISWAMLTKGIHLINTVVRSSRMRQITEFRIRLRFERRVNVWTERPVLFNENGLSLIYELPTMLPLD